jgi:hypothetical protein
VSEESAPEEKSSIVSESETSERNDETSAAKPATQQQLAEVKKEMSDYERSTVRWMKVTAVIYAVTALFILLQWKTMGDTLSEMKTSGATATDQLWQAIGNMNWMARTADGSLRQTQRGVTLSESQSKKSLQSSIDFFRTDQRAWVSPSSVVVDAPKPDITGTVFTVSYKNTGKTPAINVVARLGGFPNLYQIPEYDERPSSETTPADVLAPMAFDHIKTSHAPVSEIEIKRIRDGLTNLYLFGTVWYDGVFGAHHWSQYCYSVTKTLEFEPCPSHNACDGCGPMQKSHNPN